MCELCSSDIAERNAALQHHKGIAMRLRMLAQDYDDIAKGLLKPHTKDMETVSVRARGVIKELADFL